MSGRFTGMRHVRVKQDLMTKTAKLVRAGVIEEPGWVKVFRRLPPQTPPPHDRAGVPEIKLPTDRLFRIREKKESGSMPIYAHGELQSSSFNFAQRQLDLMNKGVSESDAYVQVEEMQAASRAEALSQVTALTSSAKEEGASIPLLLGGNAVKHVDGSTPMEQYALWQKRIADTPYKEWELGQQVMLDHWICKTALSWSWEQERYLYDEEFEEEICKLRAALFPELSEEDNLSAMMEQMKVEGSADDLELDEIMDAVDWSDDSMNERMNNWYITFGKWQTRSFVEPDVSKWEADQLTELNEWILTKCLKPNSLVTLTEEEKAAVVVQEIHELFPRLNPNRSVSEPIIDTLPPITSVRKMVLANMKMNEVPLEFPSDFDMEGFGSDFDDIDEDGDEALTAAADMPYQGSEGVKAVRSIEERITGEATDEDELEYDYEEELNEPGDDEFGVLQREIEAAEREQIRKSRRDERWVLRDGALEIAIGQRDSEMEAEMRLRALEFALPDLAEFNTKAIRESMIKSKENRNDRKRGGDRNKNDRFKK